MSTKTSMLRKTNIAVCISGGGRSLNNLLDYQKNADWEVAAIVSSSTSCAGNSIAEKHKIPLLIVDFKQKDHQGTTQLVSSLEAFLKENQIEWIILAGFLKLFPALRDFNQRVVNIHPALLPKFGGKGMYGKNVHEAVIAAKEQETGATVHFVNGRYDDGALISQIKVAVESSDTPESIAAKVFAAECVLLPKTLDKLIQGLLPNSQKSVEQF